MLHHLAKIYFLARTYISPDYVALKNSPLFDDKQFRRQAGIPKYKNAILAYLSGFRQYAFSPSPYFDAEFYIDNNPDVSKSGLNPLSHYLKTGYLEYRAPLPDFDVKAFYEAHPGAYARGLEPVEYCLTHYGAPHWRGARARTAVAAPLSYSKIELAACRALFDEDYYVSHHLTPGDGSGDPFLHYMRIGARLNQNPSPAFDTAMYRALNMRQGGEFDTPLIHFVRKGHAAGLRTCEENLCQIDLKEPAPKADPSPRLLVHLHLFYPELIFDFLDGLTNFPATTKFAITTCRPADAALIRRALAKTLPDIDYEISIVSNAGRDILPFFKVLRDHRAQFDYVLHLHSKSSPHTDWGPEWRRYLIDMTMGSADLVSHVLGKLTDPDRNIGCLYPENFHMIKEFTYAEHNADRLAELCRSYAMPAHQDDRLYPAGSFAWYRIEALAPLLDRAYDDADFGTETGREDGTLAHALERFFPMTARHQGYDVLSYNTDRRPRLAPATATPAREPSTAPVTDAWPRDTPRAAQQPPVALAPPDPLFNRRQLDIHWLIPSFAKGAGGHMTIFRMVRYLEKFGHQQTIWIQNAHAHPDQATAKQKIQEWYQPIGEGVAVRFLPEDVSAITGDLLIATDAWTAFPAAQMPRFIERFYFIQDIEAAFHPSGENQITIDRTYDFGFAALTAGPWLETFARARGMWVRAWPLCADLSVYQPRPGRRRIPDSSAGNRDNPVQIAFYARPYTPRRAVQLGLAAFEELHARGVNFHVHLFGEEGLEKQGDYGQTLHGVLAPDELARLYNDCDIGVVFSTTNYSLVPLEMAACGLPVIDLDVDSVRTVFGAGELKLATPTPYGVADAIDSLITSPEAVAGHRERAQKLVEASTWKDSARLVEAALIERLLERGARDVSSAICAPALRRPAAASVFIPTYNAGPAFADVLTAVTGQELDLAYDVMIIDSGSQDGTTDLVKAAKARSSKARDVRLIQIEPSEFQHGATRNRGIAESGGSHVAILTQDAKPANPVWLGHLLSGFAKGDRVAGVIGRHRAYPEHGAFVERDMDAHFDALAMLGDCLSRADGLPSIYYPMSPAWQMLLYFYSDNNSAIAKAAWKECPYPEIDWGEDYVWARKMMNLGWQKAYVDTATVYHSHGFEGDRTAAAARAEGQFWKEQFGLTLHGDPQADIRAQIARDEAFARQARLGEDLLAERRAFLETQIMARATGAGVGFAARARGS